MTFDYSLAISGLALLISAFVAGWTVYRDAIQKPKFRVTAAVKSIYQQHHEPIGPDFYIEALNLGPLPNRIGLVYARPSWFDRIFRKKLSAMIMHDHSHLANTASGQRVEVGDSVTFVFPLDGDFQSAEFAQFGVADGYGTIHWAARKNVRKALGEAKKALEKKD